MSASSQEIDPSISNFVLIFKAASERYKNLTKQDLDAHPFAEELGKCDSPAAVLNVFRVQAQAFEEFRKGDERLMKWLDPTVNILTKFSATIAAGNALIVSFNEPYPSRSLSHKFCFAAALTRKYGLYWYNYSPRGRFFPICCQRVP
jgi:hypothetical protein